MTSVNLYAMTKQQRSYWRRKMAGLCTRCGKAPPCGGRILCDQCQSKEADWKAKTDPDGEKRRAWARARADRLRQQGLCMDCGRPAKIGRTRCENCLKRMRDYYARRKAEKHGCGKYPGRTDNADGA